MLHQQTDTKCCLPWGGSPHPPRERKANYALYQEVNKLKYRILQHVLFLTAKQSEEVLGT